jgi:hypothetical protein
LGDIGAGESSLAAWPVGISANTQRGKYVGTARLTSAQTADLTVPVVALVRSVSDRVSLFEGTNAESGTVQTEVALEGGGSGQTWIHIPKGYFVLHALFGVAPGSTNLQSPVIDIGADGVAEWAFSGLLNVGVSLDHLETPFNDYLKAHPGGMEGSLVPIRVTGNAGQKLLLGGLQIFFERIPNELRLVEVSPDGTVRLLVLGHPGSTYRIEASSDLVDWATVKRVTALDGPTPVNDPSAAGASQRFYRTVLE